MAHRGWKRDGFTPEKKGAAVKALGKYGTVVDAARVAGISDTTFYRHLNKDPEFARMCELAREAAAKPIETLAWERATVGADEVTIRGGEVVQVRRKPSDAMLRVLLQASNPKKFGRMSRGGATRKQIEKKLRTRIEAEVRAEMKRHEAATLEETCQALAARLKAFGIRQGVLPPDTQVYRTGGGEQASRESYDGDRGEGETS